MSYVSAGGAQHCSFFLFLGRSDQRAWFVSWSLQVDQVLSRRLGLLSDEVTRRHRSVLICTGTAWCGSCSRCIAPSVGTRFGGYLVLFVAVDFRDNWSCHSMTRVQSCGVMFRTALVYYVVTFVLSVISCFRAVDVMRIWFWSLYHVALFLNRHTVLRVLQRLELE